MGQASLTSRSRLPVTSGCSGVAGLLACLGFLSCDPGNSSPAVGAASTVLTDSVSVSTASETLRVLGGAVSADFFTEEARALLGRVILPSDFEAEAPDVVLLSHDLWTRLGSSPDLIGTELEVEDSAPRIVGVMPPDFESPLGVELWFPRRAP